MNHLFYCAVLMLFFNLSCSQDESAKKILKYQAENASIFRGKFDLKKIDSVEIILDSSIMKYNISVSSNGNNSISILNRQDLTVFDYNISAQKLKKSTHFFSDGPNAIGSYNNFLYYHRISFDRILLFNQKTQSLIFATTHGKVLRKYKFEDLENYAIPYETHPFALIKNTIYIPSAPSDWAFMSKLKNSHGFLAIDLISGKKSRQFSLPDLYKTYYWTDNHVFYIPSAVIVDKKTIISYPIEPNLYVYTKNKHEKKYISASNMMNFYPFGGKLPNISKNIMPEKIDMEVERDYLLKNNYFLNIFYFPKEKCFIRIARVGKPDKPDIKPHYAAIFFDKNFIKCGEADFPIKPAQGEFWEQTLQVGNELWAPSYLEDENRMKYIIYRIQKK